MAGDTQRAQKPSKTPAGTWRAPGGNLRSPGGHLASIWWVPEGTYWAPGGHPADPRADLIAPLTPIHITPGLL